MTWVSKLKWFAETHKWSDEEKLVQLELLLSGRADQLYDVLPDKEKATFNDAIEALEKQLLPERREALMSIQLMRQRQRPDESIDAFVHDFESMFR